MKSNTLLSEKSIKIGLIWVLSISLIQLCADAVSTNKVQAEQLLVEDNIIADTIVPLHKCKHWDWEIYRGIHWLCNWEGEAQDIPNLEGNSREERMRELLRSYWKEYLYETFFYWGKMFGVYPELAICIAKADTSLGRQTKSANNLGNVWNNDRGNTVEFDDEYKAVKAIYQTLNNQYLWGYQYLWELSRKYNADWMVYATSPENWHNNVANCMGVIRGETVTEHFAFRF